MSEGVNCCRSGCELCWFCGINALYMAARRGHINCVKSLIEAGADVNSINKHHNTPIMGAAEHGFNGCVEELINAGADVNSVDLDGDTALMCAAITGKGHCISTLIEVGSDVNIANNEGYVPIMCFARNGDDKSITELIRAGADVNIVNKLGETAMKIARAKGHLKCIGILVQAGAVVNDGECLPEKVFQNKNEDPFIVRGGTGSGEHVESHPGYSGGISHQMALAACCDPSVVPTRPSTSEVNDEINMGNPPKYEELFPFMLK